MKQWFVGVVHYGKEYTAAAALREQGYRVRLPKKYTRCQEGKRVWAEAILRFKGYIFVESGPLDFGPINHTKGMDDSAGGALLGGATPFVVRPGIIERLEIIQDVEMAECVKPEPRLDLREGDQVQIVGDRNNPAYCRQGLFLGAHRGIAEVLEGFAIWKVPESDLRKVEERKAA